MSEIDYMRWGKYYIFLPNRHRYGTKDGGGKKSKKLCSSVEDQDLAPGFKVVSHPDLDPDPALTYLSDKFFLEMQFHENIKI